MVTATITSKGQITIPKFVRESLCLNAGDRIAFEVHGRDEAIMKPITKSVDDVFGLLHNPSITPQSIDDMDTAIGRQMSRHKL
jgi:AbrB family looped-hinge helix DNA binding protein